MPHSPTSTHASTRYRSVDIEGVKIFYREAGVPDAPTSLLCTALRHRRECSTR